MSGETRPYDRHTQGTYWYMGLDTLAQGHARARTRSRTDTLALATDTLAHPRRRGCTNEAPIRAGTLSPHRPGTFT